ncbi:NAD(P)/FAD-dependent oxidoreductase [Haladaptatus sp. F3-133]|uniref:NAD(P)/FAD-dependent oxidoreductase n=1 Tax=Halorutilus salinus TaxID=2487751 RepID=A0A9Q4C340_9EURY|nr:NAD(P)/FAD-dependent oxidoreductase [Halorutilus salinus]MCX2818080.1 NAD(P)/FAD-dependent oxidoreductase [Halorutilus salinus]
MADNVVVLGSGYAGAGSVKKLQRTLDDAEITWVSDIDYHLVLHESHRVIRDPEVQENVTIPVETIADRSTEFVQGRAVEVDTDEKAVSLEGGDRIDYDYLLVCVGSQTAFFGIPGLEEHALTLKSLDDALEIHDEVVSAAEEATEDDPARVVVGGAGLSGIQSCGEIAELRDEDSLPVEIYLVEGLDNVFPPGEPGLQNRLAEMLEERGVGILTGDFIGEVDDDTAYIGEKEDGEGYKTELSYDVLLWTGGITGRDIDIDGIEADDRSRRIQASSDFTTNEEGVFAIGDTALIEQDDEPAPPTAQAAWQAAEVAGENVARAIDDRPLKRWRYDDKGTLISVGEKAVAHDVKVPPGVKFPLKTFGGTPGKFLKKFVAARWIADMSSWGRAKKAWGDL